MAEEQSQQQQQQQVSQFDIIRIYTKDMSFETPNIPQIFKEEWKPETSIELDVKNQVCDEENKVYEVVLRLTVTTKLGDKVAYLCEVNQAGLFHVDNMEEQQQAHALNAYAPSILFPYARETISSLVAKATFPQLLLAPINFDMLFVQRMQQLMAQKKAEQ
ncbi:MAG: protein-export chaperone SecB [Succinivibrionaceae bacterium]